MRYIAIDDHQQLYFDNTTKPTLTQGECLIKVKAIGVNRADILQKQGMYPAPAGESTILGIEACGDIVDIKSSNSQWKIGDKVFAIVPGGAYAEYVKVSIDHLIKLPKTLSYAEGAAIAEVFLTAYQCLFTIANLQPNANVLIHAGASGVGTAAIQLAKYLNCQVAVTVGSEDKAEACKALGADEALNYRQSDFVDWAKQHKHSFDVILDVVAGEYMNKNINVCALDGHIVLLSMLGGRYAQKVDVAKMLLKRVNIHATTLRSRSENYKTALIKAFNDNFAQCLAVGAISPVIYQQFDWQEAETAHQVMSNNENIGKLILLVS